MHHYRRGDGGIQRICIFNRNIQFFICQNRDGRADARAFIADDQRRFFRIFRKVAKSARGFVKFGRKDGKAFAFQFRYRLREVRSFYICGKDCTCGTPNDFSRKRIYAVLGKNAPESERRGGSDDRARVSGIADAVKKDKPIRHIGIFFRRRRTDLLSADNAAEFFHNGSGHLINGNVSEFFKEGRKLLGSRRKNFFHVSRIEFGDESRSLDKEEIAIGFGTAADGFFDGFVLS